MHVPTLSGIACVTLSFVDTHGHPLQVPAQDCTRLQTLEKCTLPLHPDNFDELTVVGKVHNISVNLGKGTHTHPGLHPGHHIHVFSCSVCLYVNPYFFSINHNAVAMLANVNMLSLLIRV